MTSTCPEKTSRKVEKTLDFHGIHFHIKENYFETGVPLEHNHSILRLLPYHPELSPTTLIWASVKKLDCSKQYPI
jgi:transposase